MRCSRMNEDDCCARRSTKSGQQYSLWSSASFRESGTSQAHGGRVNAYSSMGGDACALPVAVSSRCANAGSKSVSGGAVRVTIPTGRGRRDLFGNDIFARKAGKVVEPDTIVFREGTTEWQLDISSAKGKECIAKNDDKKEAECIKKEGKKVTVTAQDQKMEPVNDVPVDKPAGQKPAGDKPAGQKPADQKPAGQKPAAGKPAGGKPKA